MILQHGCDMIDAKTHGTLTHMNTYELILASGSPRRKELLTRAGFAFRIIVSDATEDMSSQLMPAEITMHNAMLKAESVANTCSEDCIVIGADTVVAIGNTLFGKPQDKSEARSMLNALSGQTHQVITGVCLAGKDFRKTFSETTDVTFRELSPSEIGAYVDTGEPLDKAGAYGIQGKGGALVDHIDGDYDNVVGLPVARLVRELEQIGVIANA